MIQIENVSFQYNNSEKGALKDVSISVDKGECVLLCGASGCGKTTITRLINGLIPHFYEGEYSGNVSVYGMNVMCTQCQGHLVFYFPNIWTLSFMEFQDSYNEFCRIKKFVQ